MSDSDDDWNNVIKLPSSDSSLLKKRKTNPLKEKSKTKYICSYGNDCKLLNNKKHINKYSHNNLSEPPKKKQKQVKLTKCFSRNDFDIISSQEDKLKDLNTNNNNKDNNDEDNMDEDDKTLEMSDFTNMPYNEIIKKQVQDEDDKDDGFKLEKDEILLLSEKSLSGDSDLNDMPLPPSIEVFSKLPDTYTDYWDSLHVKLPCSPKNTYRRKNKPNRYLSRWYLIQTVYASNIIQSSKELEESIRSYQSSNCRHWDFSGLHAFFRDSLTNNERKRFFKYTLPHIIYIALSMPKLFSNGIPMLISQKEQEITLSQKQLSCLLANGFLCTFPSKQGKQTKEELQKNKETKNQNDFYQNFNFKNLFQGYGDMIPESQAAKLICLLTYFERIIRESPNHNVTFYRNYINPKYCVKWRYSGTLLVDIDVNEDGYIEDQVDCLQVDFANKMIGGGVLGSGCVQEEIRFMISPELLCSLLFTAELGDTECLIIKGSERFSNYTGYASSFDFGGPYFDKSDVDSQGRLQTFVVAIDALYFGRRYKAQYTIGNIKRELNKAFCGFEKNTLEQSLIPLATGNWGCGVFGGHFMLKFVIQLIAASQAGRSIKYYTFREKGLKEEILQLHKFLVSKRISVGQLYKSILVFCRVVQNKKITKGDSDDNNELQEKCRSFAIQNPPDISGFLMYFFQLPENTESNNEQESQITQEINIMEENNDINDKEEEIQINNEIKEDNIIKVNKE